jgi:hypothetical protein
MRFEPEVMDTTSSYSRYLGQFAIVRFVRRADSQPYVRGTSIRPAGNFPTAEGLRLENQCNLIANYLFHIFLCKILAMSPPSGDNLRNFRSPAGR